MKLEAIVYFIVAIVVSVFVIYYLVTYTNLTIK